MPNLKTLAASALLAICAAPALADWNATLISLGLNTAGATGTIDCPPGGSFGTVWGTGTYTSDSSICTAAVHYGWITQARGGRVSFQQVPGLSAYQGAAQNGVTSFDYGSWSSSFQITAAVALPGGGGSGGITWDASPDSIGVASNVGQSYSYACPPHAGPLGTIWGTDVYTSDSPVCVAAQHRGLVSAGAGGSVTILILGGQPVYVGTFRNGVQSDDYPSWDRSYVFQ